jgi:hypothetical protein
VRDGKHAEDQVSSTDIPHLGQRLIYRATNGACHSADKAVGELLNATRAGSHRGDLYALARGLQRV